MKVSSSDAIALQPVEVHSASLQKNHAMFGRLKGPSFVNRASKFASWVQERRASRVWPYSRALLDPAAHETLIAYDDGHQSRGLNFASQDYLALSSHPLVAAAAHDAIDRHGPHSAGSPVLLGNTVPSIALESELADLLQMEHVTLFPTGWGAGYGTIVGLVRPHDHVVLDDLSHACLQDGAHAATAKVHRFAHNRIESLITHLREIRTRDTTNAILVVTEGLFSMDSDVPDLEPIQLACREFEATLLVDVAHDLGSMGPGGTGTLGIQKLVGKVDLVMGSFSKTFSANGGFLASHSRAIKEYVKYYGGPHIFSNAISPVQCAIVREALRIVRSEEGEQLRADLERVVCHIRSEFAEAGIQCQGKPSAIIPVSIGSEKQARLASKSLYEQNVFVNLVEFPAVAVGQSRFRMQVMASHSMDQGSRAAKTIAGAIHGAKRTLAEISA